MCAGWAVCGEALLLQCPPLTFADGRHALLNVELWFPLDQLLYALDAHGSVQVSMELLFTHKNANY